MANVKGKNYSQLEHVYIIHLVEKLLQYYYANKVRTLTYCIMSTLTSVKLGFKHFLIFVKNSVNQESMRGIRFN
jgi:hypothetical protein